VGKNKFHHFWLPPIEKILPKPLTAYVAATADANPTTVERIETAEASTIKERNITNAGAITVNASVESLLLSETTTVIVTNPETSVNSDAFTTASRFVSTDTTTY